MYLPHRPPPWALGRIHPSTAPEERTVILVQYSYSTHQLLPAAGVSKLKAMKQGVETVFTTTARSDPQHRIAVIIFNTAPTLLASFARPSAPWPLERLRPVAPAGKANIAAAIEQATMLLEREAGLGSRRILLLSDGGADEGNGSLDIAIRRARQARVSLRAIGYGKGTKTWDEELLRRLARGTVDGRYWCADALEHAVQALTAA